MSVHFSFDDDMTYYSYLMTDVVARLNSCSQFGEATAVLTSAVKAILASDGACVVLRDGDECHYVDEDAIAPLWKGNRYPTRACISGWCMENRESVAIRDVFADPRIPHEAYRPTFVKSLAITPIQARNPFGALGAYWSDNHETTAEEIAALEGLASAAARVIPALRTAIWERKMRKGLEASD